MSCCPVSSELLRSVKTWLLLSFQRFVTASLCSSRRRHIFVCVFINWLGLMVTVPAHTVRHVVYKVTDIHSGSNAFRPSSFLPWFSCAFFILSVCVFLSAAMFLSHKPWAVAISSSARLRAPVDSAAFTFTCWIWPFSGIRAAVQLNRSEWVKWKVADELPSFRMNFSCVQTCLWRKRWLL